MSDERYQGGGTRGGKWGCALAALFGIPVFCSSVVLASLSDCVPGSQCHEGFWLAVILPTVLVTEPVGFGVRWLMNLYWAGDR